MTVGSSTSWLENDERVCRCERAETKVEYIKLSIGMNILHVDPSDNWSRCHIKVRVM